MDIFKLLGDSQLRLHHVEEQGGRHDGTAVNLEIIVFLDVLKPLSLIE